MLFLNYIHNFRGLAILYIIIIHTISAFNWEKAPHTEKILMILLNNGSILFVFIAGYLFQHLSYKYEPRRYLYTKFRFVVLPYIICSIPAIIYFVWFERRWDVPVWYYSFSKPVQIALFYITGKQLIPYWFMPMIFIFYMISPLLIWLDKKKILYWLIPIMIFMSMIIGRGFYPHRNFMHFLSVFVIGMFFSRYREKTMQVLSKDFYLYISTAVIISIYFLSYYDIYTVKGYFEKLLLCTVYLSLFYKFDHKIQSKFAILAELSFGMYFLHSYIISIIKLVYKNSTGDYFEGDLIKYFLFTVLILTLSGLAVNFLKKVLGRNSRYVIGS